MINLALVDDHIITRTGLKNFIELNKEIKVVLEAGDGKELFQKLTKIAIIPDILLMDITMPQMNGFEAIKLMRSHYPGIKIIVFSMLNEEDTVLHMIQEGACGYISKTSDPAMLVKAILTVAKTGFYIGGLAKKDFFSKATPHVRRGSFVGKHTITPKQLTFIKLSASNLDYHEIAEKMKVSPKTVENYRDSIFHKLGINNRASLVLYGFKTGLIDNFID